MNLTIEMLLGIDTTTHHGEEHEVNLKPNSDDVPHSHVQHPRSSGFILRRILTILERTAMAAFSVVVSVVVPEFSSMMAFLGSFSSFLLCVLLAKIISWDNLEVTSGMLVHLMKW